MELTVFSNEHFMKEACKLAIQAGEEGEIPVGAIIVSNKRIIGKGYNQTEKLNDVTAHAEILAITAAQNYLGAKYLKGCEMFVTLEPCVMCAGALFWSQIDKLNFGAKDDKRGFTTVSQNLLHPKTKIESGLLSDECSTIVSGFFLKLRKKKSDKV